MCVECFNQVICIVLHTVTGYTLVTAYSVSNAFMGSMLSFYQCKHPKSRQILPTGPLNKQRYIFLKNITHCSYARTPSCPPPTAVLFNCLQPLIMLGLPQMKDCGREDKQSVSERLELNNCDEMGEVKITNGLVLQSGSPFISSDHSALFNLCFADNIAV